MNRQNRISEGSEPGEDESVLEFERLKTPSPATGQLRVEGEEGTDGRSVKADGASSPGGSRKMIFPREKKSLFKHHSKSRLNASDSPKRSPKHIPDNISEKSDDCSESPIPEDKKKQHGKNVKKSFRKVAMKVKIGKKLISKSSSSEDTDVASLGPSEAGEEEVYEGDEGVDRRGDTTEQCGAGDVPNGTENEISSVKTDLQAVARRPENLIAPSTTHKSGGINLRKTSKSNRQPDKRMSATPSESTSSKRSLLFERRISAPGNFKVSSGTPVASGRTLNSDITQNDGPLAPIVEISSPAANSDSVFSSEEEVFAVRGIKCCMWGQWMCVSNVGGHVMAFSFQMNDNVTVPKVPIYTCTFTLYM